MKYSFLFLLLHTFSHTLAYELAIYTDQEDKSKAQEVIQTFKQTYPFNTLEINYTIVPATEDELNCEQDPQIERLLICNSSHVRIDSAQKGYDQAFIVRNVPEYGGSGGGIPVISTGSTPRMMLHEYLHTLSLCDEYQYSASESKRYCKPGMQSPNLTIITPKSQGYSNDQEARSEHSGQIPWFGDILATTLITNNNKLGTGRAGTISAPINNTTSAASISTPTGLYRAKTCDNKTPALHAWHPGGEKTIMDELNLGLGATNEKIVREILIARGASPIATTSPSPSSANVSDGERAAKEVEENQNSSSNDTSNANKN